MWCGWHTWQRCSSSAWAHHCRPQRLRHSSPPRGWMAVSPFAFTPASSWDHASSSMPIAPASTGAGGSLLGCPCRMAALQQQCVEGGWARRQARRPQHGLPCAASAGMAAASEPTSLRWGAEVSNTVCTVPGWQLTFSRMCTYPGVQAGEVIMLGRSWTGTQMLPCLCQQVRELAWGAGGRNWTSGHHSIAL